MRRRLGLLAVTAMLTAGGAIAAAGPAAAVAPPPSNTGDHDCRVLASNCNPGLRIGWENHRNVGG